MQRRLGGGCIHPTCTPQMPALAGPHYTREQDGKSLQESTLLEKQLCPGSGRTGTDLENGGILGIALFVGLAVARIICTGAKGEGGQGFWGFTWKQVRVKTDKTNQFGMLKSCQQPPNTGTPSRQPEVCGAGILG